jgi:hypothetical protein
LNLSPLEPSNIAVIALLKITRMGRGLWPCQAADDLLEAAECWCTGLWWSANYC